MDLSSIHKQYSESVGVTYTHTQMRNDRVTVY